MGLGCWTIGGPWEFDRRPAGWGRVDNAESVRTIRRALDLGVTFFDTADVYGCGHSERVLGRAFGDQRDGAVIATKFGLLFDGSSRTGSGADASPEYIRKACEGSLRCLGTDRIDVYQLHAGAEDAASVEGLVETLEELVAEGGIRAYGTAVDAAEVVGVFAEGDHCVAVQTQVNVFGAGARAIRLRVKCVGARYARRHNARSISPHITPWLGVLGTVRPALSRRARDTRRR